MPIVASIGGESWPTDALTVAEAEQIEKATERSWVQISPFKSIVDAKEILVAFLSRSVERDVAVAKVEAMTLRDILDAFVVASDDDRPDEYEDGLPKAEGGTSTDGSSGAPDATAGPLT